MMPKFRKKPVVIEAIQYTEETRQEVIDWSGASPGLIEAKGLRIRTLEGHMLAWPGDWIIKGVNGEFYPCKPDIFAKTYEAVP